MTASEINEPKLKMFLFGKAQLLSVYASLWACGLIDWHIFNTALRAETSSDSTKFEDDSVLRPEQYQKHHIDEQTCLDRFRISR
uniref:Uncharacterized protein n=1 Tax=Glossina morsitans morsitans TaxID=37546 RepID=A0ABK9NG98_GLOMM